MSRRTQTQARVLMLAIGTSTLLAGFLPYRADRAQAASVPTPNACQDSVQKGQWTQIPLTLAATSPASATAGTALTLTGITVTAELSATYLQAGINLGVIHDGQVIHGQAAIDVTATNATPATTTLSGSGSGTIHAPGGVAQPLDVATSLSNGQWTPTAAGTMTLAEALAGSHSNSGVTAPTNGAAEIDAALLHATNDEFIICKPGTSTGPTNVTFASTVAPFVSVPVSAGSGSTTTTAAGATTTTVAGATTTTVAGATTTTVGSTTTTAVGSTTTTVASGSGPAITLSSSNVNAGDAVTVTGSAFDPAASVSIEECSPRTTSSPTPQDECDVGHAVMATSDAHGGFSATIHALKTGASPPYAFTPTDAAAVCPPATGNCTINAANTLDSSQSASQAITFVSGGTSVLGASGTSGTGGTVGTGGSSALATTGPYRSTLLLAGAGLLMLDIGWFFESATRPGRRLSWLRPALRKQTP